MRFDAEGVTLRDSTIKLSDLPERQMDKQKCLNT